MKNLSRILSICFGCIVAVHGASANVATTAGSNLTTFNPNNAYNNQWATLTNPRSGTGSVSAKVDFGNCNSLILRCAQPKCSNGGCTDSGVASAIVTGCVQSNSSCNQYGNDLVQYMTAQLVAQSNAKINEQKNAIELANAQAAAQAAASAQAAQSEQISAMQNQMYEMQQAMAEQQAQSAAQLQEALSAQAAQNQQALDNMKTAATEAAKQTEAGISSYQQDAINRGVSADTLERQKIAGQIQTEIDSAEVKLAEVKKVMQSAFDYADCSPRGDDCKAPKRIKKWRELASGFTEPYDEAVGKLYDAIETAQMVGIDISQIYMMLDNSCSSWAQYTCPKTEGGTIQYNTSNGQKTGSPMVCNKNVQTEIDKCLDMYCKTTTTKMIKGGVTVFNQYDPTCAAQCRANNGCTPCVFLKTLSDGEAVYEGWINSDDDVTKGNVVVVACSSGILDVAKIFRRRTRNKNGAGLVDMDIMEKWINQKGMDKKEKTGNSGEYTNKHFDYCKVEDASEDEDKLLKARASRIVAEKDLCVDKVGDNASASAVEECPYISHVYAMCDVHPYNSGKDDLTDISNADIEKMKEIIALKTTVFSQQMYKQYEYLKATLRRFQIQLEKAVLTSNLQAAGAKSEDGSSVGGLLGSSGSKSSQYQNCSGKDEDGTLYCLRQNYSALSAHLDKKKCTKAEREQLENDVDLMNGLLSNDNKVDDSFCKNKDNTNQNCTKCLGQYNIGLIKIKQEKDERELKLRGWNR